ncbi:LamG-like jellyroll fold domain-containing protein [Streptomyces sediminimaris]|uniref:LamG-like jellyroll fold domain-containing protein n=1 Tax=Streptomyces sediminimaris TaxID=3383721 RepID=UPI00399A6AB0
MVNTDIRRRRRGVLRRRRVVTAALTLLAGTAALPVTQAAASSQSAHSDTHYSTGRSAPAAKGRPASADAPQLPDGYGPSAAQLKAMTTAAAQAAKKGAPVVVDALTTPRQQVTAVPGGGFELTAHPHPVRTKQHGHWTKIDLTLHRGSDGRLAPAATAYGTVELSGGGTGPLVTTRSGATTMTVGWPGRLPAPVVQEDTATYKSVFPSVDLVVSATASGGFRDVLVVKSASAAHDPALRKLNLTTKVSGGHLRRTGDGSLGVTNRQGKQVLDAAAPSMWDSNTTLRKPRTTHTTAKAATTSKVAPDRSGTGQPGMVARIAPVTTGLSDSTLSLKPDAGMLKDPSTVYPVYIDPTFNWHPYSPSAPAFDEVKQGCPSTSFYNQTDAHGDYGRLGVGYNSWGGCYGRQHAIYQWKLSSTIWGSHIHSATVEATEVYSAACSGTYTVNLHWSKGMGSGTDWNNRPGYNSYSTSAGYARSYNPTYCPSNGNVSHGLSVYTPIAKEASGHASTFTVSLSEDGAESNHDGNGFSRFSHNPSLQVYYDFTPYTPAQSSMSAVSGSDDAACDTSSPYPYMGKTIASTPPVLKAKVSDKDSDKQQATFEYWIDGSSTTHTGLSGDNLSSGSYATYSLPSSFTSALTDGQVVDWRAKTTDGQYTSAYSVTCHFTAEPTAPDAPQVTSENNVYPDTDQGGGAGAAAGTAGTFDVSVASGASAAKFVYSVDIPPATSNPPSSAVVTASSDAAKISITPYSPGPHTLWVYAVDAAGDDSGTTGYPFLATGNPNTTCSSLAACFDNTGISADSAPAQADLDGSGNSFSATDLTGAGWTSGGKLTVNGASFTLPAFGSGQKDNVLAANQTVGFSGSGSALEFLATSTWSNVTSPGAIADDATAPYVPAGNWVSGSYCFSGTTPLGPCVPTVTVTYTDGTSTRPHLTVPGWSDSLDAIAAMVFPHENKTTGQQAYARRMYAFSVPLDPGKTIASVTLPDVSNHIGYRTPAMHIFGMATRDTTHGTPKADGTTVGAGSGQSWTGAWANPNEGQYNFQGSNFSDQTFRIAMKTSIAGSTVRVKLDNALGTSKLSIGHVTVAPDSGSGSPSAVPAATPTGLTFAGSQSVTVPAGGSVYSDPLSFDVSADQYLLVSFQLSNSVPYLVQHSFANNAYEYLTAVGAGDKTTDTTGTPFSGQYAGWFTDLVTDLDVSSADIPTKAVLGDGLVDPFQPNTKPVTSGRRISDMLAAAEPTAASPYGTVAAGIESNELMTDNPQTYNGHTIGGPSALSRIDRDILDEPGISSVVVDEGLEDLLHGATDDDLEANGYTTLVQQLQAWGISTTLAALTPCDGYAGSGASPDDPCTSTIDGYRNNANAWLGGMNLGNPWGTPAVYYADFDTALAVPDTVNGENKLSAAADTGDHVNLTNAGYGAETSAILSPHDTWRLDDGDGATSAADSAPTDTPHSVNDYSVGASPLTLNGTTAWTNDSTHGEVLSLDGSTGNATTGGQVLDTTGSYSVSAWVDLASLPTGSNAAVAAQDGTENSAFYLKYDIKYNGHPGWALTFPDTDTASPSNKIAYASGATANTWTHLVGTFDATTGTGRLYVNGTLAATVTGVTPWASTGTFTVGRAKFNGSASDYLPGEVSNVQAWNYALTGDQVSALYKQIP